MEQRHKQLSLNMGLITALFLVIMGAIALYNSAHAEIQTDQQSYSAGDILTINGHEDSTAGAVTIKILDPNGSPVSLAQIKLDSEGNFKKTVMLEDQWTSGEYTIAEQYGNKTSYAIFDLGTTASDTISFGISSATETPVFSDSNATNPALSFGESNATSPATQTLIATVEQGKIPTWVRGVFGYWAEGKLSDQDLVNALEFLIKVGVISLN